MRLTKLFKSFLFLLITIVLDSCANRMDVETCTLEESIQLQNNENNPEVVDSLLFQLKLYNLELPLSMDVTRSLAEHPTVEADMIGGFSAGMLSGFNPAAVLVGAVAGSMFQAMGSPQRNVPTNYGLDDIVVAYVDVVADNPSLSLLSIELEESEEKIVNYIGIMHNLVLNKVMNGVKSSNNDKIDLCSYMSKEDSIAISSTSFVNLCNNIRITAINGYSLKKFIGSSIAGQIMALFNQAIIKAQNHRQIEKIAKDYKAILFGSTYQMSKEDRFALLSGMSISSNSFSYWNE